MDPLYRQRVQQSLEALKQQGRCRVLRAVHPESACVVMREGQRLINFSSNDYLGLAFDSRVRLAAAQSAMEFGAGAGASRLICGTFPLHQQLEEALATLKGQPKALVMGSGFQTNEGVIPALLETDVAGKTPHVFADRLIHASMHEGLRSAGIHFHRYHHNDLGHLAALFEKHAADTASRFILTESVFSMDGDRADLPALCELAAKYQAMLYVDEAHATGVLGPKGAGLCSEEAVKGRIDLVMGTFGKALGGFGAFVACEEALRDHLVNRCRSFIYSTALPPPVLAAALKAVALLPEMEAERGHLQKLSDRVRQGLRQMGVDTLASSTQIIPAIIGSDEDTLAAARHMEKEGILAVAIRPPTVPPNTGRLRLTVTAAHTMADVDQLLQAFSSLGKTGS